MNVTKHYNETENSMYTLISLSTIHLHESALTSTANSISTKAWEQEKQKETEKRNVN